MRATQVMKGTGMDERNIRDRIRAIINDVPKPDGKKKSGKQLHKDVAAALERRTNFTIVKEDTTQFLRPRMPVWRDKKTCEIEPTANQRKIDIVVYEASLPIALIEVESDLNDLQLSGISTTMFLALQNPRVASSSIPINLLNAWRPRQHTAIC
jgi:hypothetical protein